MARQAEVTIIGAGPAGMASAIYLHRAGRSPLVLEKGEPGGLLRSANLVENYPGFPGGIKGQDLVLQFTRQLELLGIGVVKAEVRRVSLLKDAFQIDSTMGAVSSKALIVASGTRPKKLSIRGAAKLTGKNIFAEIVEMPLSNISGRKVLIVGGGDAAFDYGINLSGRGAEVTILARSEPDCLPLLRARAETSGIDILHGFNVNGVRSSGNRVTASCEGYDGKRSIETDYVLLACGREPSLDFLGRSLRVRSGRNDKIPNTGIPGLFMAGDVVRERHRQTAIAVGDGIHAGMMVDEFLRSAEGNR